MKPLGMVLADALEELAREVRGAAANGAAPQSGDTLQGVTYRVIAAEGGSRSKGNVVEIGERRRSNPTGKPLPRLRSPMLT